MRGARGTCRSSWSSSTTASSDRTRRDPRRAGGARRAPEGGRSCRATSATRPRSLPASTTRAGDAVVMIDARPSGPARADPDAARALARGRRRRLRRARGARRRDALQAASRRAGSTGSCRPPRRIDLEPNERRLPAARPPRARRAAGDARAQPLPARHDRLGRLHADGGRLRARRRATPARPSTRCARWCASRSTRSSRSRTARCRWRRSLGFLFAAIAFLGIPLAIVARYRRASTSAACHRRDRRAAARRHPADGDRDHRRVRRAASTTRSSTRPLYVVARRASATSAEPAPDRAARPHGAVRVAVARAPGVAGLVAAHRLAQAGHAVDVYERWPGLGGQAATIDVGGGHLLERYYHHLFTTDRHIARALRRARDAGRARVAAVVDGLLRRRARPVAVHHAARPAALQAAAAVRAPAAHGPRRAAAAARRRGDVERLRGR